MLNLKDKSELLNVDSMTNEEIEIFQQMLMSTRVNRLEKSLEKVLENQSLLRDGQVKLERKMEINNNEHKEKLNDLENEVISAKEIAVATNRVRSPKYGYVNQTDFGSYLNVSISNIRVGKLLKIVGIAQPSKRRTIPYREYIPTLAQTHAGTSSNGYGYSNHKWHYVKCMEHIDKWLHKNNHYNEFYMIESEKDLEIYIDRLYEKYIESKYK